jgi:branched-chain amino acid transport system substrate-binding protein
MTRWPEQLDFSAELSKARASDAESIFVFYPGASGIQFVRNTRRRVSKGRFRSTPCS